MNKLCLIPSDVQRLHCPYHLKCDEMDNTITSSPLMYEIYPHYKTQTDTT